jgi:hypothetical protein
MFGGFGAIRVRENDPAHAGCCGKRALPPLAPSKKCLPVASERMILGWYLAKNSNAKPLL